MTEYNKKTPQTPQTPLTKCLEQRCKLENHKDTLNSKMLTIESHMMDNAELLSKLNTQILALQNDELDVTDHAIVRYLERIAGINMEQIKNCILTDSVRSMHKNVGDGKYPVEIANEENCTIVIQRGKVVTLYSSDSKQEF